MNAALRRAGVIGISFALIAVCAGLGVYFLAAAGHDWLSASVGAAAASAILGVALLAPLLGFIAYSALTSNHPVREADDIETPRLSGDDGSLRGLALDMARTIVKERPLAAAGLIVAVGAFALRNPGMLAAAVRRLRG